MASVVEAVRSRSRPFWSLWSDGPSLVVLGASWRGALAALAKVAWNTALAESLTPVLQAVEIGLRNWVDRAIRAYLTNAPGLPRHPGPERWLENPPTWMHPKDREVIEKAEDKLRGQVAQGKRTGYGHDDLLATVSFVLWSNMILGNTTWAALSSYRGGELTRGADKKSLHKLYDDVRNLRNRAYHLEPIFAQTDLWSVYKEAVRQLRILDPRLANLIASIDRFPTVFDDGKGWKRHQEALYLHYGLDTLE